MTDYWPNQNWFDRAIGTLSTIPLSADDLVVRYTCTTAIEERSYHQVFRNGALSAWLPGAPSTCDVHLRQPLSTHLAMLGGYGDPVEMLTGTTLVVGDERLPLPPLDETLSSWGHRIPVVSPGTDLFLQQYLTDTPFGVVPLWFRFQGGPVVAAGVGLAARQPDIVVRRRFDLALRERNGEIDLLESLEGGEVLGAPRSLMLFLGTYDQPDTMAARRSLARPTDEGLGVLGRILSSHAWLEGVRGFDGLTEQRTDVQWSP